MKSLIKDKKFLLFLIFIMGTAFRLINLGTPSLDFDEIYSVRLASLNLEGMIEATSKDFHPPLYYFLLHLWVSLLGNSEVAVRLFSVLSGLAGIWGIYLVAKFIFNESTALFASFLFAISHLNVEFSQEARMYSLLVLLTIFSMYFLLRLLKSPNLKLLTGFVLFNSLLLYTHVYSFFIIAAEYFYFFSLYFLARDSFNRSKHWLFHASVLVLLLFAPWLFTFFKQFYVAQKLLWIPRTSFLGFFESLIEYSGSFSLALILVPLLLMSFLAVRISSGRKNGSIFSKIENMEIKFSFINMKKVYFLMLWLIFPIFLPFTISQFLSPIFLVKYTIAASAAFILMASCGFSRIKVPALRYAVIALLMIISLWNFSNDWAVPTKERWREAISYLNISSKPGDLIILNAGVCSYLYDYYTSRKDIPLLSLEPGPDQLNRDSLKAILSPYINKHNRFWLLVSHSMDYEKEIPKTMDLLTDSTDTRHFFTNNRKYFFISNFDQKSFDLYLLKSYLSPDITIYFFDKKNNSFLAQEKKGTEEKF